MDAAARILLIGGGHGHVEVLRRFALAPDPAIGLALTSTGDRRAVASCGGFVAEGDRVWRWKDRIDRCFMAKYAMAPAVPPAAGPRNPR